MSVNTSGALAVMNEVVKLLLDWDGSGTDIMGWNYVDVATGCNIASPQL